MPGTYGFIATMVVAAVVGLVWGWYITRVDADLTGLEPGVVLTPDDLEELSFSLAVRPRDRVHEASLTFDGREVMEEAEVEDGVIRWTPDPELLREGEHELALRVPRPLLGPSTMSWTFTVDATPPRIDVPPYLPPHRMDAPVVIEGTVVDADEFTVDGKPHELDEDGGFRIERPAPPTGPVRLEATDAVGNTKLREVFVPVEYPDDIRGVHVTAAAWHYPPLRAGVAELITSGVANTVVLSIKDEGGVVGHQSRVPWANRVGASLGLYDLAEEVDELHALGARVVGRVVAFRDPRLADAAWEAGRRDLVIQRSDGSRYGAYGGGFTNFAHPDVQKYNIALAVEAVEAGVDDILWDYVRRPDGDIEQMRFPGFDGEAEQAITRFLSLSHDRIRALGGVQGASVFGIAATRPEQIAQNIAEMAAHTDYIAPMLYPSHWNLGEYRVENPEAQPNEIVERAMLDFKQQVARTGRPLVAWLQHFSMRVVYGPAEIQAQVRASREVNEGLDRWLMWDPGVTYDLEALRGA